MLESGPPRRGSPCRLGVVEQCLRRCGADADTRNAPLVPRSPYAVSKLAAEHYCRVYTELHGLETVSLRYFNVYGPRQRPDSAYAAVIPLFIDALRSGTAGPIVHGDGLQSRDFTFIADAGRGERRGGDCAGRGVRRARRTTSPAAADPRCSSCWSSRRTARCHARSGAHRSTGRRRARQPGRHHRRARPSSATGRRSRSRTALARTVDWFAK